MAIRIPAAVRRFWSRRFPSKEQRASAIAAGQLMQGYAPIIGDGVNYGMPIVLPRELARALGPEGVTNYLREATVATSTAAQSFRFQFDTPQRGSADLPFIPPTEDPLMEWAQSTRRYVLENTHSAYQRNPIANAACKYMADFVVGEGFNLACKNELVEEVLEEFMESEDNEIRCYERQALIDLLVDGELFIRKTTSEDGEMVAVPLRPWECDYIKTQKGMFRRRESYRFQFYQTEGDDPSGQQSYEQQDIPATDILHVAINRHGYELRGRPELYVILPWLRAHKEWLENRARQNFWRSALLWWVKVKTVSASAVAAVASRYRRPPSPGSVAVESDNVEINAVQNSVGAGGEGEDGRQIKLMNAIGMRLPEYMLSDGENANLATATKQELPALTTFESFQRTLVEELWYPLFKAVIQAKIDAGKLPEMVEEQDADGDPVTDKSGAPTMIETMDAFDVSYAPLENQNLQTLATAMQIAIQEGLTSKETASTRMGFDWGIEQKRMASEQREMMDAMARGEMPVPPGMTPDGLQQPERADEEQPGPNEGEADSEDEAATGDEEAA